MKNFKPMLNAYPDSMGGTLGDIADIIKEYKWDEGLGSFYILPSLYHSDLDRGFSVIDYDLEESLATREDLEALQNMGIDLKLDFVLNHASVNSPQFRDLLEKGEKSPYKNFFIDWNQFWEGKGEMTPEGYIQPDPVYLKDMFFRKAGLPILMLRFPDGTEKPYWNTFYQKLWEEDGRRHYLGQMDINIKEDIVWDFYEETLQKLAAYGAKIVRLDAFAYAPKEAGKRNFLNEPGTWELLERIRRLAEPLGLTLLPEIHASYEERIYRKIAEKGYLTYDFFLPGLIIDAIEKRDVRWLKAWGEELIRDKIQTVNMLGCHDGIPLLDLKGLLPEERIQGLIDTVVSRGGHIKDLHGAKNVYYQVNAAYYSALGEDDQKLLLARALQLFMPGKPQIWYLDLLVGTNDYEAVRRAGEGGHKEINRTNYSLEEVASAMEKNTVQEQLKLLKFRASHPAFTPEAEICFETNPEQNRLKIRWKTGEAEASLRADLEKLTYQVSAG